MTPEESKACDHAFETVLSSFSRRVQQEILGGATDNCGIVGGGNR